MPLQLLQNEYCFNKVALNHKHDTQIDQDSHTIGVQVQCINQHLHTGVQLLDVASIFLTSLKETVSLSQDGGILYIDVGAILSLIVIKDVDAFLLAELCKS